MSKWTLTQRIGAAMMLIGAIGLGYFALPESHSKPSVAIENLGLVSDHAVKAAPIAAAMPKFRLVGAAAAEDNTRKRVCLWDAMLQVNGGQHFPNTPQQVGDCVSWGAANAVNYLQAVQIVRDGKQDAFHAAYPPWIYGTSRVDVGRAHGSRFTGDGSVGAYAAEALNKYGCLRADYDQVPPYSGAIAREWGSKGVPAWAKEVAKPYLVQTVAPVNSAADARDAICNGFPVTIASGWWGTDNIPVVNGRRVAQRTTSWGHQQCLIAYDGSGKEPLFYCLNSWGPNAHPAPMQGEPPGGYWIRFRDVDHICGEGDSWALSAFDGFPADELNWDDLLKRPTTSMAVPTFRGPVGQVQVRGPIMFWPAVCFTMLAGGFVLFRGARLRNVATVAAIAVAVFVSSRAAHAQDSAGAVIEPMPITAWESAAIRETPTPRAFLGLPPGEVTAQDTMRSEFAWGVAACRPVPVKPTQAEAAAVPWAVAASRDKSEGTNAINAIKKTLKSLSDELDKIQENLTEAMVPFSDQPWYEDGHPPSIEHLVSHGCPRWVAEYYRNDPVNSAKIHGGYHERELGHVASFKMLKVTKPPATTVPIQAQQAQQPSVIYCNNQGCRLSNGQWLRKQR